MRQLLSAALCAAGVCISSQVPAAETEVPFTVQAARPCNGNAGSSARWLPDQATLQRAWPQDSTPPVDFHTHRVLFLQTGWMRGGIGYYRLARITTDGTRLIPSYAFTSTANDGERGLAEYCVANIVLLPASTSVTHWQQPSTGDNLPIRPR